MLHGRISLLTKSNVLDTNYTLTHIRHVLNSPYTNSLFTAILMWKSLNQSMPIILLYQTTQTSMS